MEHRFDTHEGPKVPPFPTAASPARYATPRTPDPAYASICPDAGRYAVATFLDVRIQVRGPNGDKVRREGSWCHGEGRNSAAAVSKNCAQGLNGFA